MFSEQVFANNLAALVREQGHSPAFAAVDAASTRMVGDPTMGPRVDIKALDGGWVVLDAAGSPAPGISPTVTLPAEECVVLVGPGLGYSLDVLEAAGAHTKVLAIEPDPGLAVLFLARRSWQSWFDSGRLRLLVGPGYVGASACGRFVDGERAANVVVNPVLSAHRPKIASLARAVADRIVSEARRNADARRRFAGRYLLQTLENLRIIQREGDVAALDGAFRGRPAILVGAGPSLDRNAADLAALQDRAVIVAADTTLRPLLKAGIRPHIVVGVDPAEINARHLSGATKLDDIHLVAEGSLHPSAFEGFAGRTFVFKVSDHEPWPWLRTLALDRGVLRAWGSVITSAFDLALRMGCDPIVFAGLDLAYTGNRPYCSHTIFDDQWRDWERERGWTVRQSMDAVIARSRVIEEPDIAGTPARTSSSLIAFRNWLTEQIALTPDRTFINATGAGILHGPRIAQRGLREAMGGTTAARFAREELRRLHAPARSAPQDVRKAACGLIEGAVGGDVFARWIRFTAGTVTAAEASIALARAVAPTIGAGGDG
jgi:6-hydroxymethylpterin diphosphokinase MptE-like protein